MDTTRIHKKVDAKPKKKTQENKQGPVIFYGINDNKKDIEVGIDIA